MRVQYTLRGRLQADVKGRRFGRNVCNRMPGQFVTGSKCSGTGLELTEFVEQLAALGLLKSI